MNTALKLVLCSALLIGFSTTAQAGIVDPNCTAEKAAKSAAAKATVGVGGRCSPAEAAKDTVGIDQKDGPLDRDDKDKEYCKDKKHKDEKVCKHH